MLKTYLEARFGLKDNVVLALPMSRRKVSLEKLVSKIESRGTEQNIINNIEKYNYDKTKDTQAVLGYLTGIAERFVSDKVI